MIVVHHLNNSRSQRVLWLLEELQVPYEIKRYERTADQRAPKELLEISPLGKSPVITDDLVTLAESGAIVEYLISKYGNGKLQAPASGPGYLDNLYYTHYAEGSLMPILVQKIIFDIVPQKTPFLIRPLANMIFSNLDTQLLQPEFKKHFDMIESHLATVKTGWFAGGDEPTAADFQMAFPLEAIVASAPTLATPKIVEYVERVHARPAYKTALDKGGEYAYAKM
ncbi:putative glutathione S-transferase [Lyophyllum shimeji]|uniref:glutathione transferase n=1 Tax=Lyophyllum shimeji TaxID=47721 RepID=A0A9P3PPQ4_LYOSH|nr:putative glutathione S-transferase [Lyophyllum shimeji]